MVGWGALAFLLLAARCRSSSAVCSRPFLTARASFGPLSFRTCAESGNLAGDVARERAEQ